MRFRGNANNGNCAPRYLNANNAVSNTNVNNGGSAQRRASKNDAELITREHHSRSGEAENIKDKGCERSAMAVRDATNVTERHPDGQTVPSTF